MKAPAYSAGSSGFRDRFRRKQQRKKKQSPSSSAAVSSQEVEERGHYQQVELATLGHEDLEEALPLTSGNTTDLMEGKQERAASYVGELTLKQKIRLLSGLNMWQTKPVPSSSTKGLPSIPSLWICDGPHGLRKQLSGKPQADLTRKCIPATCFPTASALACSWNTSLLYDVGVALGRECISNGVSVLLGPGMNIIRHPCGGRSFEYFSEDPHLTGRMAVQMVMGIQSTGVAACPKHFSVNNQETDRWVLDVIADERTLREVYWSAWQHVVTVARPWTIMAAYNKINGLYCTENRVLMSRILRDEWNFGGCVMTDWGATHVRSKGIAAGIDLEMPGSTGAHDYQVLEAYYNDELSELEINQCAVRVMSLLLLGKDVLLQGRTNTGNTKHDDDMNGDGGRPFRRRRRRKQKKATSAGNVQHDPDEHHELAHRAAVDSCVLLKNDDNLLPLDEKDESLSIAIIGEFADKPRFQGMGSSQVVPHKVDSAAEQLQEYTTRIAFAPGYSCDDPDNEDLARELIEEAVDCARECTVAIVFVGLPQGYEAEGFDRLTMELPETHDVLVEQVAEVNSKTIVVLTNGAPVEIPWVDDVPVILEAWLAGQAGGAAVADILFGHESPGGRLAQTFCHSIEDLPSAKYFPGVNKQVQYREGLNVGYRYFNSADKPVMFPFGHGLTYTTFEYSNLRVEKRVDSLRETQCTVTVDIKNIGTRRGSEVVQVYVKDCERSVYRPFHELRAFEKIALEPDETKTVTISLDQEAFSLWDVGIRKWIVEPGRFDIQVGASSRDIRLVETVAVAKGFHASKDAREAHPPCYFPIVALQDDDDGFRSALGYAIPDVPPMTGIFDYDTPLREIQTSWLGCQIHDRVLKSLYHQIMKKKNSNNNNNANHRRLLLTMQSEMVESMPLRGLVVFSNGQLNFDLLDLMLSVMNGEYAYAKALCMAPGVLISWTILRWCGSNNRV